MMVVQIKKKSDLIEMIIYGGTNGKINNKNIDDISINKAHSILKENNIVTKSLPGYGNINKCKRYIKPYTENNELSVEIEYDCLIYIQSILYV